MTVSVMLLIVAAVIVLAAVTVVYAHKSQKAGYEKLMESQKESYEQTLAFQRQGYEKDLSGQKNYYEKLISEIKENHEKSLKEQISAIRTQMTASTEEILKAREKELSDKAAETFKNITGGLAKDLQDMKKSFEDNKQTQTSTTTGMKTFMEEAVKKLKEQTENIGTKADNLADALRSKNKIQGIFGEVRLENIFKAEGFAEGRDYDREATLKGELGERIVNEDSGRGMRPDFIIHYPDSTDIIIDSKVDLKAYADYFDAQDDAGREDAARRNLAAMNAQIDNLSKKDYSRYLAPGRRSLGYVLMFVPIYGSLQLAKSMDDGIWRRAYERKVLITTEETLMPFLRMIRTAWVSVEQVKNQERIIDSAQKMIERVYDFAKFHKVMGDKLKDVQEYYEKCESKLKDSGQSIITSAKQVVALGVPEKHGKKVTEISAPLQMIDQENEK